MWAPRCPMPPATPHNAYLQIMGPAAHLGGAGVGVDAVVQVGGVGLDEAGIAAEKLARAVAFATVGVAKDDVIVVGRRELAAGRQAHIHEEIDGARFRISADSFGAPRIDSM